MPPAGASRRDGRRRTPMQRICFTLRVRPDRLAEYRDRHRAARWQAEMAEFFELPDGARPDSSMEPLEEVFHLD
jgi:L-rhamnose mutarotase